MSFLDHDRHASAQPVAQILLEVKFPDGDSAMELIQVYANETIRIGRDDLNNDFVIRTPAVSRNHLEFYSIRFDDESGHYPMVYVRDRQSNNGTYVNDALIGDSKSITPGRLLVHGDEIAIKPNITFKILQPFTPKYKLNRLQAEEVKVFHNHYIVTNQTIGHGGSARVHLAIDRKRGEHVVCKVYNLLEMRRAGHEESIQRLMKETFIRCQIEHPNISSFRSAYTSRSTLYVFEDLATSGDLYSLMLRSCDPLLEIEVRWIVRQIISAVAYLHLKGVIHRDLKLENILCAICPKPGHRVVVTDFGHAAVIGESRPVHQVGTEGWRAPELIRPRRPAGPPADIWSIGVLCICLLSGRLQIESVGLLDVFAHKTCGLREPTYELGQVFQELSGSRGGEAISDPAKDFISRCFRCKPEKRITAAEALAHRWLCGPEEDYELFLRREKETTKHWRPRPISPKAYIDLPDLTNQTGQHTLYCATGHNTTMEEYKEFLSERNRHEEGSHPDKRIELDSV